MGKSKTEKTENNRELFQGFQKQSLKFVLLKKCSLSLKNASGRLLLEFLWWPTFGKMVKWQKINGENFPIFPKQSPSAVLLKRCLSFLKNTSGACYWSFSRRDILCAEVFCFYYQDKKIVFCFINI